MVASSPPSEPDQPRLTMRQIKEQFQMERHQELLRTALDLVTTEGLGALTMQGLADQVGCGVGTLYRHFPSKDALVAELQREALDIINTSFRLSQAHLDALLAARGIDDPATASLARVVAAARFWIAAEGVYPQEVDLSRRMFIDPVLTMDEDEATRVVPAALRLLDLARQLLDDAVATGSLDAGAGVQRAVVIIAGTTGVLMTSGLARWGADLFDGRALSTLMVGALLRGWGADPAALDLGDDLVANLAEHGQLVPPIRR